MNLLKKIPVVVGVVFVGSYLAYQYLLSDEQREALRSATEDIRKSTQEVSDAIAPLVKKGPTRQEEESAVRENQARTREQWRELGY